MHPCLKNFHGTNNKVTHETKHSLFSIEDALFFNILMVNKNKTFTKLNLLVLDKVYRICYIHYFPRPLCTILIVHQL